MTQEALKLALEALEWCHGGEPCGTAEAIAAIKEALAQPEQEPVAWKLMPRDATDSMLKAMDECSTEGYDERLYAGHAASVYMAAWDAAPITPAEQEPVAWRTFDGEGGYDYCSYEDNESYADDWNKRNPNHVGWVDKLYTHAPQRTWVGLTDEDRSELVTLHHGWNEYGQAIEAKLKDKNS